jgi:hypothetical protein
VDKKAGRKSSCKPAPRLRFAASLIRCVPKLLHRKSKNHLTMVQLPAVNTPQFDWCRSHLPNHPQPVPPIFDPAVAARAIVWAAHHRRRELYLGMPTVIAIEANKFIPGLLDRYLGRTGYASQQTSAKIDPHRPNNLFEPIHGTFGARGSFDGQARPSSLQFWLTTHRACTGVMLSGLVGFAMPQLLRRLRFK